MDEAVDRIKATYRENCDRLVQIMRKYDPDNFLRYQPEHQTGLVLSIAIEQLRPACPSKAAVKFCRGGIYTKQNSRRMLYLSVGDCF